MFENTGIGCQFSLPDPLCMRHIEMYETARDEARMAGAQFAPTINWAGAIAIVEDWKCKELPDPRKLTPTDLADAHGVIMQIVIWVAGQVATHVMSELFVPKN